MLKIVKRDDFVRYNGGLDNGIDAIEPPLHTFTFLVDHRGPWISILHLEEEQNSQITTRVNHLVPHLDAFQVSLCLTCASMQRRRVS